MDPIFAAIEQSPLSIWLREDLYAFFVFLIIHSIGLAFLVGSGLAISLRVMGVGKGAKLAKFRGFFPVMWIGLGLAIFSGLFLLYAYPAKALTNPVFAVKFICLIAAGLMTRQIARRLMAAEERGEEQPPYARWMGLATGLLFIGGLTAGKFLPYTNSILSVS